MHCIVRQYNTRSDYVSIANQCSDLATFRYLGHVIFDRRWAIGTQISTSILRCGMQLTDLVPIFQLVTRLIVVLDTVSLEQVLQIRRVYRVYSRRSSEPHSLFVTLNP